MNRVSVVLSAYNGSKYITEQLESLRTQTRKPDEVIIIDDCSTDDTFSIVDKYIKENNLDGWYLQKNPDNWGWEKSFANAIISCTADIIFTCDQDDIWMDDKIEIMCTGLEKVKEAELLVADYIAFSYLDVPDCKNSKNNNSKKSKNCRSWNSGYRWRYIERPGCVFAFTKELREKFSVCWKEGYAHDLLLWQIAALSNTLYHIDYDAIYFRRHDSNSTPPKARSLNVRLARAVQSCDELENLKETGILLHYTPEMLTKIESALCFEKCRVVFFRKDKFDLRLAFELFMKKKEYYKISSWVIDLLCKLFWNE